MQIASIAFSVIIVLAGIAFNFDKTSYRSPVQEITKVLGTDTEVPKSTTNPESTPVKVNTDNIYIYPNSRVLFQTVSEIVLESSDPASIVTDWYQEKIRDQGFNVKSFVKTNVNGNVENKLSASDGESEVNVEITKEISSNTVNIKITY